MLVPKVPGFVFWGADGEDWWQRVKPFLLLGGLSLQEISFCQSQGRRIATGILTLT